MTKRLECEGCCLKSKYLIRIEYVYHEDNWNKWTKTTCKKCSDIFCNYWKNMKQTKKIIKN